MKTVLLVGGTGNLGALIGRALLKRGARLRLLVRPGSRSKVPADLAHAAEILEDEQTAFQGVFSVVSAVQGGPETIVDAQLRFLRAARKAGVRRFIASDYSMNLFTVPEGDNVSSDHRREFAEELLPLVEQLRNQGFALRGLVLSHRHIEGAGGAVPMIPREYGVPVFLHPLLTGDAAMGPTAVQTENGVEYLIRPPVMMNVNDAQLRAQWRIPPSG